MSLSRDEASNLREKLEAALHESGLGWIIQQAGERMLLGKTVPKDVDTAVVLWEGGRGAKRPGRRQTSEFLASEPFDEIEKLEILLEAVRAGLLSPRKMQQQMFANLGEEVREVNFTPDDVRAGHVLKPTGEGDSVNVQRIGDAVQEILSRML